MTPSRRRIGFGALALATILSGLTLVGVQPAAAATVPGLPTNVRVFPESDYAYLNWIEPADDGGSPVTSYIITPYQDGTALPTVTVPYWSGQVTGLTAGVAYTFTVRAVNAIGDGPDTAPTAPVVIGPVADPPTGVTATASPASASVSWTPPVWTGVTPITSYLVSSYRGSTRQSTVTVAAPATSTTVTGLTNGVTYTFKVQSVNATGNSPFSTASNAVTPFDVPTAPTGLAASASPTKISVNWAAPTSTGGMPILDYTITPFLGTAALPSRTQTGLTATFDTTELALGQIYTFAVTARTAVGVGPAATSAPTPFAWAPTVPTATSFSTATGFVTLTWGPPAETGGIALTGYRITYSRSGATAPPPIDLPATATTVTVPVDNGYPYSLAVRATNGLVLGAAYQWVGVIAVGPPSTPPTGLSSPESRDGAAYLSWKLPTNNGGDWITGYVVTPYKGSVAQAPQVFATTDLFATVTGLTNGQTYSFTVAAMNPHGVGVASTKSSTVQVGRPDPPKNITGASGNASVTLSWAAQSGNGSPITGYVVTPILNGVNQSSRTFTSPATTQTVTGLTNGASYTFKVQAVNQWATGPSGSLTTPVLVGLPGSPAVTAGVGGTNTVTLTWAAPDPGGAPITTYVVTPYVGATAQAPRTFDGGSTTQTITGLTIGTSYTFTVRAANSYGNGPISAMSSPYTPVYVAPDPPAAPATPTVTPAVTQLTVSWVTPDPGDAPINGYTVVRYENGSATAAATTTVAADQLSLTVTGLSPATSYRFSVSASNAYGTGAPSPLSEAVTPTVVLPDAPPKPTVVAGPERLFVSWSAPSSGSGPIYAYQIERYDDGSTTPIRYSTSTTTLSQYEMPLGRTSVYVVRAVTAFGEGPRSEPSDPATPLPVLPSDPIHLSTARGPGQLTLTWDAGPSGSAPLDGYVVYRYVGSSAVPEASTTIGPTPRSLTVTGLSSADEYRFRIAAFTVYGTSTLSDYAGYARPIPVGPQPVAKPTVAAGPAEQLTVSWSAPAAGSAPVTGYRVERFEDGAATPTATTDVIGPSTSLDVTDLSPLTAYRFTVSAITDEGSFPDEVWPRSPLSETATPVGARVLSGTVVDTVTGTPLAGIRVRSFVGTALSAQTTTAADGTWTISNVNPGSYSLQFTDLTNAHRLEYWKDALTQATATLVPMGAKGLRASIEPTNLTIGGRTTATLSGAAIANVRVRIYRGSTVVAEVRSAADGTWTAGGLTPGSYGIQFYEPSHRIEYWQNAPTLATATLVSAGTSGLVATLDP